jgi:hypothetical protein
MELPTRWGIRETETRASWPCDAAAPGDALAWYRGVEVGAPAPLVFRWLCQLKVAPYSYDWIDNAGRRSPRALTPGAERLAVGQRVMIFTLADFAPGEHLTLATRPGAAERLFGRLWISYRVRPDGAGSRLAVKVRVPRPRGVLRRAATYALAWGDLLMMRRQLLTLRRLAERDARRAGA